MTTASETVGRVVPPVSRSRVFWRSPFGRSLKRVPFYLLVLIVFVYALFPFAWALRCAFTPEGDLFSSPLQYIPESPTLDNFKQAFQAEFFRKALLNSALVAGGVTLLSLAIGSLAAFAAERRADRSTPEKAARRASLRGTLRRRRSRPRPGRPFFR